MIKSKVSKNKHTKGGNMSVVLCGSTFRYALAGLRESLSGSGVHVGEVVSRQFPDGELCPCVLGGLTSESFRGRKVVYIQSTYPPADNLVEFALSLNAITQLKPSELKVIVPYFGYARQDKIARSGTPLSVEAIAGLIPKEAHLYVLDFHNPAILGDAGVFRCETTNLLPVSLLSAFLREKQPGLLQSNAQVVAPDKGARGKNERLQKSLGIKFPVAQLKKERDPVTGKVTVVGVDGQVQGTTAILWDDMLTSGGTAVESMLFLQRMGVKKFIWLITHPLFFILQKTKINEVVGMCDLLVTTDSLLPRPGSSNSKNIIVLPLIDLLKEVI